MASAPLDTYYDQFSSIIRDLHNHSTDDELIVLSCGSWASFIQDKGAVNIFNDIPVRTDIPYSIRPPIDWLNSAALQWGVWTDVPIEDWLRSQFDRACHYHLLTDLKSLPFINKIFIAEISENPIDLFKAFIGTSDEWSSKLNQSTHPALLELLVKNRGLYGRSPHNPLAENILFAG
ncbi:MAG: hypothetical protein AAF668_10615 [Pseudomonadota bacterium]